MPGKMSRLKSLASHKQLLIAESELNRAQLAAEYRNFSEETCRLVSQASAISSLTSAAVTIVTALTPFGRKAASSGTEHFPWFKSLLKSAGLCTVIWRAFRPRSRSPAEK